MKHLFYLMILSALGSCQKDVILEDNTESGITHDSLIQLLDAEWKFKAPEYSDDVFYALNNWEEWRMMINNLEKKPAKSISAYQKKVSDLLNQIESLPETLPEGFQNQAILSRINLLKTHAQTLDMLLELNPIPYKETLPYFNLIQKDIRSIANQFQEVITKKKYPNRIWRRTSSNFCRYCSSCSNQCNTYGIIMNLKKIFSDSAQTKQLLKHLQSTQSKIKVNGLIGSALSFEVYGLFKNAEASFLLIFNDKEEAAYYLNDIENLLNKEDVLFYPSSYKRPYQIEETDNANVLLRAEVLNRINAKKKPFIT